MADEVDAEEVCQDIYYIDSKTLKTLSEKLEKGTEITDKDLEIVQNPEALGDEDEMLPVDMKALDEEYDDVEEMMTKLGPKGAAEAFVKAHKFFEANKDKIPEDERAKPMTGKEWKDVIAEEMNEGEEEELLEDEEELDFEGEEEEDGEEDPQAEEPPPKKAKVVSTD
mmetsp:Transcript_144058/g.262015  ORF Transcript_144058/g.262015 Transcript_144058/m.262015 type:complete len:168 (+) Transcript_144058:95-598(+)